ncbi:MAG: hypothetical protein KGL46_04010 [Hyphomicrobiales bacterium]|nr:hypothetical protein [Hyphomicrobiales bacterium]
MNAFSPAVTARLADMRAQRTEDDLQWSGRFVRECVGVLNREAPQTFLIDEMPDNIRKVDIGTRDGAIIVHYRGSKYSVGAGQSPVMAQRVFTFDVHVLARGIQGRSGAPNVVDIVRVILQNRQIEGAGPLAPVEDGFANEEGGVWDYVISFRGELPAVGRNYPHRSERT